MKNLVVLFLTIFFCPDNIANEPYSSWILSQEGKYFCTKISIHAYKVRFVAPNGEKMSIPVDRVNSFSLNGRQFDKLPLYKNGKSTNKLVFMELICRSKDCSLYRYGHCKIKCIPDKESIHNYFIYKGDNLQMATNCVGLPQACLNYVMRPRYK
jgi:hypothetical protein